MKIKKLIVESKTINEETEAPELNGGVDIERATASELAAEVTKSISDSTDGTVTVDPAGAVETAKEIKTIADTAKVKVLGNIGTDNELTRTLDAALADAKAFSRRGDKVNCNVLVVGLPGSGKTACVYEWAARNKVNIHYLDAKNNDLEAYINGYTLKDDDEKNTVTQAWSKALRPLERENSVLFLDEYNRQTKPNIRASLLTLINEKCIAGDGPDGRKYFNNLLFTIACINPVHARADKGASELNSAELSRFVSILDFDSTPADGRDFFRKYYNAKLAALDPHDPYYVEDYTEYAKCQDLVLFILKARKFKFDGRKDMETLYDQQKKMLNLRALTEGIAHSRGSKDRFITWVKTKSGFLQSDIDMILDILLTYTEPTVNVPNVPVADTPAETTNTDAKASNSDPDAIDFGNEDDELDTAMFGDGTSMSADGAKREISDAEAMAALAGFSF